MTYDRFIGWDISSNIVGACALDPAGIVTQFEYLDLRNIESEYQRINEFEKMCYNVMGINDKTLHIVEDRLAGFSRGFTNAQTLMKLGAVNFACCWILSRDGNVQKLHPSTVKAMMKREGLFIPKGSDKKQLTFEFTARKEQKYRDVVSHHVNRNGKPQPYCFDMADAYLVARAGYLKEHEQTRKAVCDSRDSGDGDIA